MVALVAIALFGIAVCGLIIVFYSLAHQEGRAARMKPAMKALGYGVAAVTILICAGSYYGNADQ